MAFFYVENMPFYFPFFGPRFLGLPGPFPDRWATSSHSVYLGWVGGVDNEE